MPPQIKRRTYGRGTCPFCKARQLLDRNGLVAQHHRPGSPRGTSGCNGYGRKPQ